MLTPAERNSLLVSLTFLIMGAGIKAWKKWHVEIGPFDPVATAATPLDKARTGAAPPGIPKDSISPDSSLAGAHGADSTLAPSVQVIPAEPRKPAKRGKAKPAKTPPACPVDGNTASEERLANLPGVGPRTAAALIAYRKAHGPFRDTRELLQVKGIGEKKLALIAPCLILSGAVANPPPAQASVDSHEDGDGEPAGP